MRLVPIVAAPAAARLAGAQLLGIDQQAPGVALTGIDGGQPADLRFAGVAGGVAAGSIAPLAVHSCRRGDLAINLGLDVAMPILTGLLVGLLTVAPLLARAHRLGKEALVMLRVLEKALGGDPVVQGLGIARQGKLFVHDLLRCAAHLALGPGAFEDAIDVGAVGPAIAAAPRPVGFLRWSHRIRS